MAKKRQEHPDRTDVQADQRRGIFQAEETPLDYSLMELDKEWVEQPKRYDRWARALADAEKDMAYADLEVELTKAQAADAIRKDPESYGLEKATVDAVKDKVLLQPEVKAALGAAIEARYLRDTIKAGVTALDHRKKGLENQTTLLMMNYHSMPKLRSPTDGSDVGRKIRADQAFGMKKRLQ